MFSSPKIGLESWFQSWLLHIFFGNELVQPPTLSPRIMAGRKSWFSRIKTCFPGRKLTLHVRILRNLAKVIHSLKNWQISHPVFFFRGKWVQLMFYSGIPGFPISPLRKKCFGCHPGGGEPATKVGFARHPTQPRIARGVLAPEPASWCSFSVLKRPWLLTSFHRSTTRRWLTLIKTHLANTLWLERHNIVVVFYWNLHVRCCSWPCFVQ